ncbi:CLUMA_CG020559, isoform A [Clunio marinus]|uniref:CLUMA_CG020559, isoform A n=1 Tax=Clunio marinus TaxID=568069 RepID=A0A1J1J6J8_9DIPT|nr:CLUMA_CG020559, isoform A [Clunio marinus]
MKRNFPVGNHQQKISPLSRNREFSEESFIAVSTPIVFPYKALEAFLRSCLVDCEDEKRFVDNGEDFEARFIDKA